MADVLRSLARGAATLAKVAGAQYSPRMAAPTSLEGLRSYIRKLIMLSDLMSRLQPRKKTPKTTVREYGDLRHARQPQAAFVG